MNVGYFHTRDRYADARPGSRRACSVTCGLRFDRIELLCTARDLRDPEFVEWIIEALMTRVVDARPEGSRVVFDVRP